MPTLNAKAGREQTFERRTVAGDEILILSGVNSNGIETMTGAQLEIYVTGEGAREVRDQSDTGPVITTMDQYDRCRFLFRGAAKGWEQIA